MTLYIISRKALRCIQASQGNHYPFIDALATSYLNVWLSCVVLQETHIIVHKLVAHKGGQLVGPMLCRKSRVVNTPPSVPPSQTMIVLFCRNSKVMDEALAMHDKCLRSVLHQCHGYEVSGTSAIVGKLSAMHSPSAYSAMRSLSTYSAMHSQSA